MSSLEFLRADSYLSLLKYLNWVSASSYHLLLLSSYHLLLLSSSHLRLRLTHPLSIGLSDNSLSRLSDNSRRYSLWQFHMTRGREGVIRGREGMIRGRGKEIALHLHPSVTVTAQDLEVIFIHVRLSASRSILAVRVFSKGNQPFTDSVSPIVRI